MRIPVSMLKVKGQGQVTRSANVETGSASYRPKGKAYELETWYTIVLWNTNMAG